MKIGILTLPLTNNYGGILQAYALQVYLKQLGYDVILLDRKFNTSSLKSRVRHVASRIYHCKFHSEKEKSERDIKKFIFNEISKTDPIYSEQELSKIIRNNNIDTVIVGSDQVWRIEYSHNIYKDLFLKIGRNKKIRKLSYSASFGNDEWHHPELTSEIKDYLKDFHAVSVREESGITICEKDFENKAEQHVDPTLLLTKDHYISLFEKENETEAEHGLLTYILDSSSAKNKIVKSISQVTGLKISSMTGENINKTNYKELKGYKKISITRWLKAFHNSKFVVTDSYHGTIFSIIFQKPFIVIGNQERGLSRFNSLLSKFHLQDRMIMSINDLTEEKIKKNIPFDEIEKTVILEEIKTRAYFSKNLKS